MTDGALVEGIRAGQRVALSRAITLVESTRADDRARAATLLDALLPERTDTTRLAISGPPGAGKSTLIEALGRHVIAAGHQVAVLAVDPTSTVSGGSILGDKHRMTELAFDDAAYVRPSPAGSTLGGIARRTREAMILCEAAGFDVVIVETVGVGQSEVAVADLVDCFTLLLAPGGGDEIQGMKRGIVELADVVVVNKADGELEPAAKRIATEYRSAMSLSHGRVPAWERPVLLASATTGRGVPELWDAVVAFEQVLEPTRATLRAEQRVLGFRHALVAEITERVEQAVATATEIAPLEADVRRGTTSPSTAAATLADRFAPEPRSSVAFAHDVDEAPAGIDR